MKTRLHKILSIILVAVMLVTAAPLSGFVGLDLNLDWLNFTTKANAATYNGTCGPDVVWNFDKNKGELVLSGTGIMYNYYSGNIPWLEIADEIEIVVFSEEITKIGEWAFFDCDSISDIVIPDSVTSVGSNAFSCCDSLKTVIIGDGVANIGSGAFRECSNLEVVTIGVGVVNVESVAFGVCDKIREVHYWGDLLGWCSINFEDAYSNPIHCAEKLYIDGICLEGNLIIPTGITSILSYAFYKYKRITTVVISSGVEVIGKNAFYGCDKITELVILNGVESIGSYAFGGCRSLGFVIIPDSVNSIDKYAFYGCSNLNCVTLPFSVLSVGTNAFAGCQSLEKLKVYNSNCYFYSEFISNYTTIVGYAGSTAEAYANENGFGFELIADDDHKHIYSNTCDAECNICGFIRTDLIHTYTYVCDAECDLCGHVRTDVVHTFDNGCDAECNYCDFVRTPKHTDENNDGICDVCEKAISDILVGVEQNFKVKAGETVYIKFVPANSGVYTYYSSSSSDTYGYVYDADKNQLAYNDDNNGTNFSITYTFKAGTVYYLGIRYYSLTNSGEIPVTISLEELICDHNNTYPEHKYSTCVETGYDKVICDDCGATVSETELPLLDHSYKAIVSNPTCQSAGMVAYYCTSCKYAYVSEITDPVDHDMRWVMVTKPTSSADGVKNYSCSYCGLVEGTKVVPAFLISDKSVANIDFDSNTISGFDAGATSIDDYVSVETDGYSFTCDSAVIGTGTVIELTDGDTVITEFTAVVFGDVNGDGWYDGTDSIIVSCLANGLLSKDDVSPAFYTAADCNHDGVIDFFDVAILEQAGLLLSGVDQSKSNEELATDAAFIEYLDLIDQTPEDETVEDETIETPEVETETDEFDFIQFIITIIKKFFELLLSSLQIK